MGHSNGLSIQLFEDHFSYEIKIEEGHSQPIRKGVYSDWNQEEDFKVHYSRVEFHFGQKCEAVFPDKKMVEYRNYYMPYGHFQEVPMYEEVTLKEISAGIDMQFVHSEEGTKYNVLVNDLADLSNFQLEVKGGESVWLENEELVIETKNGLIRENIPLSFAVNQNGTERVVQVRYQLDGRFLSFELADELESGEGLLIDPIPNLEWGTYTGGPEDEYSESVAIDTLNRIIVTGFSSSTSMIATTGAYDETMDGVFDVMLLCYNDAGSKLWGTYWGGTGYDRAYGIDISNDNNIYITGNTWSAGMGEPSSVHQDFQVNGDEAFVAKFDASGFKVWSTYYGGDQHDFGGVIAVDNENNCYITGHTYSTTLISFGAGMYKAFFSGTSNAFVAKFKDDGTIGWATYYGENLEEGWGLDLDSMANIYVSGGCQATFGIASPGTHDMTFGGLNDAFLSKWDSAGAFLWGTYYGSTGDDQSFGCVVEPDGHAYITGTTSSLTDMTFGGGYQPDPGSFQEGFCAKFRPDGTGVWATYVGGDGADYMYGIDMGADSTVVVAGMTLSSDLIALPDAWDDTWSALYDACFVSIDTSGDYRFGTYYGGTGHDETRDVAVSDRDLRIYMNGRTQTTTGMTTSGADSETYPGGLGDNFLTEWCNPILINIEMANSSTVCANSPDTVYITEPSAFTSFIWSTGSTDAEVYVDGLTTGEYYYYADGVDTNGCQTRSDTILVTYYEVGTYPVYGDVTELCPNDTLTMWTDSTDNTVAFEWITGGTDSLDIYTGFTEEGVEEYWVMITDTNGCVVSSDTGYVTVVDFPDPTITVDESPPYCEDDVINVSVAPTDEIEWSNSATTESTTYSWTDPGDYEVSVITTNSGGCSTYDTVTITISNCLGVDKQDKSVQVYPNPVKDQLFIKLDEDMQFQIFDASGRLIMEQYLVKGKKHVYDWAEFATGTYTLVFRNEKKVVSRKIVKIFQTSIIPFFTPYMITPQAFLAPVFLMISAL